MKRPPPGLDLRNQSHHPRRASGPGREADVNWHCWSGRTAGPIEIQWPGVIHLGGPLTECSLRPKARAALASDGHRGRHSSRPSLLRAPLPIFIPIHRPPRWPSLLSSSSLSISKVHLRILAITMRRMKERPAEAAAAAASLCAMVAARTRGPRTSRLRPPPKHGRQLSAAPPPQSAHPTEGKPCGWQPKSAPLPLALPLRQRQPSESL